MICTYVRTYVYTRTRITTAKNIRLDAKSKILLLLLYFLEGRRRIMFFETFTFTERARPGTGAIPCKDKSQTIRVMYK